MRTFVLNFLIGIAITYKFFQLNPEMNSNAINSVIAFGTSFFILWLLSYFYDQNFFKKFPKSISLFIFFIKQLLKANMRISRDVVSPGLKMNPAVIAYPLMANTDLEITLLANFISLTPGSLSLDVSEDKKILYIHTLYVTGNDLEKIKDEIRNGFEKKILAITR